MRKRKNDRPIPFERLMRQFKRKVQKSGKLEDFRKKQYYTKPAQRRQEKMNAAKRRAAALHKKNQLPPEPRLPQLRANLLPPEDK
tara:strand:- start:694 stop:948 length:255 start_codon:yes stop_codon:yes gene_type:complete